MSTSLSEYLIASQPVEKTSKTEKAFLLKEMSSSVQTRNQIKHMWIWFAEELRQTTSSRILYEERASYSTLYLGSVVGSFQTNCQKRGGREERTSEVPWRHPLTRRERERANVRVRRKKIYEAKWKPCLLEFSTFFSFKCPNTVEYCCVPWRYPVTSVIWIPSLASEPEWMQQAAHSIEAMHWCLESCVIAASKEKILSSFLSIVQKKKEVSNSG